jgi:hypothetical protein
VTDRIAHDHPTVETVRASVARAGRTDRLKLVLPDRETLFPETVARVVLDDHTRHARIERGLDGERELRAVRDNPRLVREAEGRNRLPAWLEAAGLDAGRSVNVDVVDPGVLYGLRAPGERALYTPVEAPDDSLADIARDLDG